MKIIVVSDSHRYVETLEKILLKHSDSDVFIHLGDGERDWDSIKPRLSPGIFHTVRGNCDGLSTSELTGFIKAEGHGIVFTHGHAYNVKSSDRMFRAYARSAGAKIALYGHTHRPVSQYSGGLYVMNPGSVADGGCYGIIRLNGGEISCELLKEQR